MKLSMTEPGSEQLVQLLSHASACQLLSATGHRGPGGPVYPLELLDRVDYLHGPGVSPHAVLNSTIAIS